MAYTAEGRRLRQNLITFSVDELMDVLRPLVEKIPATVIARVKATGSGREKRFSEYSDAIIPRGEYRGMTWKQVRTERGLQTGNKDFFFDGIMWGSYKIVKEEVGEFAGAFTLTTTDGKTRKGNQFLVDIHSDKEDENILDITEQEEEKLMDEFFKKIVVVYDRTTK